MEPTTEPQINLFGDELPSLDELEKLSQFVHSSESNRLAFTTTIEDNINRTSPANRLALGIGLYILGRDQEAIDKLEKALDCQAKYMYFAYAFRRMGKFAEAIENFDKSLGYGAEKLTIMLEKAATYRDAKDLEQAEKELAACANFANVSAEYHYQLGRLKEAQGSYEEAVQNYKTAIELAPDHRNALFHLAYRCDLSGDEQAAIDYYYQIVSRGPVHVNALLNLAVLLEDRGEFDKALQCVGLVLQSHPNHPRAILFKKDFESSKTMYYDEEKEKKKSRKNQILETPITDFELSVRSRNCLKKMNIATLGDLLKITEAELLSYKNFGETSLREIKSILESKGLRLGMALEDKQFAMDAELDQDPETTENEGLMNKPVEDLQLSVRSRKCLDKLEIRTIGELTRRTDAELLGCKNFGVTSLNEIKKALASLGLSLRSLD